MNRQRLADKKNERLNTSLKNSAVDFKSGSNYHGVTLSSTSALKSLEEYENDDVPAEYEMNDENRDQEYHPLDIAYLSRKPKEELLATERSARYGLSLAWFVARYLGRQYGLMGNVYERKGKKQDHQTFSGELAIWRYLTFHRLQRDTIYIEFNGEFISIHQRIVTTHRKSNRIEIEKVLLRDIPPDRRSLDYREYDKSSIRDIKEYRRNRFYEHLEAAHKVSLSNAIVRNPQIAQAAREAAIAKVYRYNYTRPMLDRLVQDELGKINKMRMVSEKSEKKKLLKFNTGRSKSKINNIPQPEAK